MSKFRTLTRDQVEQDQQRMILATRQSARATDDVCREALLTTPTRPRCEVMFDLYKAVWVEITAGRGVDSIAATLEAVDELTEMALTDEPVTVVVPIDSTGMTREDWVDVAKTMRVGQVLFAPDGPLMLTAIGDNPEPELETLQ